MTSVLKQVSARFTGLKFGTGRCFPVVVAIFCAASFSSHAATFNIANGDVAALNDAINTSNSNHQNDTINLAANGTYILTAVDPRNTTSNSGLVEIGIDYDPPSTFRTLTINGNNATLMRSVAAGTPNFRILHIHNEFDKGSSQATINNVSFVNGHTGGDGGAMLIDGTATLNNCTIRDNWAGGSGGGIWATYNVALNNCTIMNNTAMQDGGGISNRNAQDPNNFIHHGGVLALTSCTLHHNYAQDGSGSGIYNKDIFVSGPDLATVDLISCTLREGGISNDGSRSDAKVTLANTLFSFATLENAVDPIGSGSIVSRGYNLTDDSSQGYFQQFTDRWNAVTNLDPAGPQNNGGPTPTIALCAGSDAVDHGNKFGLTTDQRGFPRPVDNPSASNTVDGTDIGAYEAPVDALQSGFPSLSVTTLADHDDGICGGVDCTLREAIARANYLSGRNDITLAPGVTGNITLAGAELVITDSVTIVGPGARSLQISGNGQSRILSVLGGTSAISGLTFRNGLAYQGPETSSVGGAIYIETSLSLSDCSFNSNSAAGGDGNALTGHEGGWGRGGAIFNGKTLNLTRCTFTANAAAGGKGGTPLEDSVQRPGGKGGQALGGAVFNDVNGTLTVANCTFSGNIGNGGAGSDGASVGGTGGAGGTGVGGIFNQGTMTVTSSTVSGNTGNGGAGGRGRGLSPNGVAGKGVGGIRAEAGTSTARNSLVAGNARNQTGGPDVDGGFTSSGFNLIGMSNGGTGFTAVGDQSGTIAAPLNAMLGPIGNNGGQTDTMALLAGSPAIDQGYWFNLNTDQLGQIRPLDHLTVSNATAGDGSDIGAFEDQSADPAASPTPTPTATPTATSTPTLQFSSSTYSVSEGGGSATITVTRTGSSAGTVSVQYATSNGGAIAGSDYTAVSGTILFANGEISKTFTVPITDDAVDEQDEKVNLALSNPQGATLGGFITAFLTIVDNDAPPSLSINDAMVTEGNAGTTPATFTVNLSAVSAQTVTVNYITGAGTATPGSGDFQGIAGTLTFNPGETSKTITVLVNGDTAFEPDETFTVTLSNVVNATLARAQGTGTIINDDVTDPGAGAFQFSVDVFTASENNSTATVTVTRTGGNTGAVSVQYATSDGTAIAGHDYLAASGTLTFASAETSKTFTVTILDDGAPEETETANLTLSNPQGGATLGARSTALLSIADNDPPPTPTPGLVGNVSTRLPVGTGDNALIEGFIVEGPAGSTKKIIVRAIGPSLTPFGIPDALANPTLEIHDASANNATVASNDDWKNTQVGGLITGDQSAEIASSGVPPSNDLESAIIANLAPGSYTAVVRGAGNTTGTGVVDAYDLSAASPARLANIATRGLVQPGDKLMISGFIIQNGPVRAVVRAIGPSLSAFGISNALPDTTLQLRDSNGAIVRENDDWQTDQQQDLINSGLQPTDDHEAALIETLQPGQYTAQIRGKPEQTGIGVVQVYFLQ